MFKTIKSRILIITVFMLAVLLVAFACYIGVFRAKSKQLVLRNYSFSINNFVKELDEDIIHLEDNSKDLVLLAKLFYVTDRNISLTKRAVKNVFRNYPDSLGGGIWFEPYIVNKNLKRLCFYSYRNENGKLVIDESFSNAEYDYHNQQWYKQIKNKITQENPTAWSSPYFEKQGSNTLMITIGTGIYYKDKLMGITTVDWELDSIFDEISQMKPIENGFNFFDRRSKIEGSFSLFADKVHDYIIASNDPYLDNKNLVGQSLKKLPWYNENLSKITYMDYHGKKYVPYVKTLRNGMILILCIPKDKMFENLNNFSANMILILLVIALIIPTLLYIGLNRNIINPINKLTDLANKIGKGEDVKITIEKPEEFVHLASTFDKMTKDIKRVTKETQRVASELSIAKEIQYSSLPNIFPPYPEKNEFDIYASMEAAKEVGGDFYDFYFLDENNFMFLVADVSGKGVPAALFMMTSKTLIANMAQTIKQPDKMIEAVNQKIFSQNKHGYFVTLLIGIINTKTGDLKFINCGHNLPLIKRNSNYEYLKLNHNIILGLFDNAKFDIYETKLEKGDTIIFYTDGITEAMNKKEELFGEERLLNNVNNTKSENVEEIASNIKNEVLKFSDGVEQNDDITLLVFKYNGINTYRNKASLELYSEFYKWLINYFERNEISPKLRQKIEFITEEVYTNIASYAYPDLIEDIEVTLIKENEKITIKFEDTGIQYNPLEKKDPDINMPVSERQIGGLGIFMIKQHADNLNYEYVDGKNIFTVTVKE